MINSLQKESKSKGIDFSLGIKDHFVKITVPEMKKTEQSKIIAKIKQTFIANTCEISKSVRYPLISFFNCSIKASDDLKLIPLSAECYLYSSSAILDSELRVTSYHINQMNILTKWAFSDVDIVEEYKD